MTRVVIDIPDEIYKDIKNWKIHNFDYRIPLSCILEGTVLPKGHGALINRDVVRKKCIQAQDWGDTNTYINRGLAIAVDFIDCAPTVIPADKEKE